MWQSAVVLALAVSATLPLNTHGYLDGNGEVYFNNLTVHKGHVLQLRAEGQDKDADLDCYILAQNPKGNDWVIVAKDERYENGCRANFTSTKDQPVRVWLFNHGMNRTRYTLDVVE